MSATRTARLGGVLLLAAALAGASAPAQDAPPPDRVNEAIRLSKDVRAQWMQLIRYMQVVALNLQKTDLAAARAVSTAAEKAEAALVADDMVKVVELLQTGLLVPADATQASIIRRLRDVLDTLRGGGANGVDARLLIQEHLQALMDFLNEVIKDERALERQSRYVARGDELLPRYAAALKQIQALAEKQRILAEKTGKMDLDEPQQKLLRGRTGLQALLARLEEMIKSVALPFPSPDQMAANATLHKAFQRHAQTANSDFKALANDASLAGVAGALRTAVLNQGKATDEVEKASAALEKDDLAGAQVADAEARFQLRKAVEALTEAMQKRPAGQVTAGLIAEQTALKQEAEKLGKTVEELTPPLVRPPIAATERRFGVLIRPDPSAPPAPASAEEAGSFSSAAFLDAPLGHLNAGNKDAAVFEQARVVEAFGGWVQKLVLQASEVQGLRNDPQFSRQEEEQKRIGKILSLLGAGTVPEVKGEEGKEEGGAGSPTALLTAANLKLREASDMAAQAAGFLAQQKAAPANAVQNDMLQMLEQLVADLNSSCFNNAPEVLEELGEQVLAYLQRTIAIQKGCNLDTAEVHQKRKPEAPFYTRAEQIRMTEVAQLEDQIHKGMEDMAKAMTLAKRNHVIVIFPPVCYLLMTLVKEDLPIISKWLVNSEPGPETQAKQRDVLERLEAMLKAMGGGAGEDQAPKPPPQWADNGIGVVEAARVDLVAEIQMLLCVQAQILRRTEELQALKASGKISVKDLRAEVEKMQRLEEQVVSTLRNIVLTTLNETQWHD